MNPRRRDALALGSAVVQRLLPIRAPFIMVDQIEAYSAESLPTLVTVRHFSANEPIIAAHFVSVPVVPGTLLLEGLSQSAGLLTAVELLRRAFVASERSAVEALDALRNLERRYRFEPGFRRDAADELATAFATMQPAYIGMLVAGEIKFRKAVFPGERVEFTVKLARELGELWHFEVEANVGSARVADGTLTNAMMRPELPSPSGVTTSRA